MPSYSNHSFVYFCPHPRTYVLILESRQGRERNTDLKEEHRPVASCTHPRQGQNPQPTHVLCPGIDPQPFCLPDDDQQIEPPSQGSNNSFIVTEQLEASREADSGSQSPALLLGTIFLVPSECGSWRLHPRGTARVRPGEHLLGLGLDLGCGYLLCF